MKKVLKRILIAAQDTVQQIVSRSNREIVIVVTADGVKGYIDRGLPAATLSGLSKKLKQQLSNLESRK